MKSKNLGITDRRSKHKRKDIKANSLDKRLLIPSGREIVGKSKTFNLIVAKWLHFGESVFIPPKDKN